MISRTRLIKQFNELIQSLSPQEREKNRMLGILGLRILEICQGLDSIFAAKATPSEAK